ncbi:hypothetical protein LXA43DRAFT_947373 [Ganoderma leucocontextum]|nr:hypothetical protein LXA43DRAFT_947373 [Ganoderma leucocontextum]
MWQLLEIVLLLLSVLQSFSPLIGKAGSPFQILELTFPHPHDPSQRSDASTESSQDGTETSASSERGDEDAPPESSPHETNDVIIANNYSGQFEVVASVPRHDGLATAQDRSMASQSAVTFRKSDDDPVANASATPESQSLKRDEQLWFEDGNLVLVAKDVEFRIYKGPLIAQSLVFKDMLSLPQPPSFDTRSTQGTSSTSCATVHLHGDSLPDLRHFLRMFTGHAVSFGGLSDPTYHQLSSIIRMSHKYQCEKLLERCVAYLKRFYHDNFEGWRDNSTCISPPNFERIHAIGVVNLARLLGHDKMLPGALMACCMLETEIADGFACEDGTRETLAPADLARCMVGRAKLLEANVQATLRILHQEVHPECMRRDVCAGVLVGLLKKLEDGTVLYSLRWDWTWTSYVEWADTRRELCLRCFEMLGKGGRQKDQHFEIFGRLPDMMGVKVDHWGKTPEEIEVLTQTEAND